MQTLVFCFSFGINVTLPQLLNLKLQLHIHSTFYLCASLGGLGLVLSLDTLPQDMRKELNCSAWEQPALMSKIC